jgi:hypothetical protein
MRDPYELNEYDARLQEEAARRSRMRPADWTIPFVSVAILAVILGGLYYYRTHPNDAVSLAPTAAVTEQAEPTPTPEPEVRYPIQRSEPVRPKPLPALHESDADARSALADLIGKDSLNSFFNLDSLVRRIVVTADNISRDKIPQRYILAKRVGGDFRAGGKERDITIAPENYRRYTPYVRMFEAVDVKKLINTYVYFYPLLQQEYKNIGSPKQYFNDRVVEAIDELLAAPEMNGPIRLVQPKVFYQYADPSLESLSAGQKLMIRMGAENAARVKAKLREIRTEIVAIR